LLADRISAHVPGVASAAAFPDLQIPIHDQVVEAEKASTRKLRGFGSLKELPDVPGRIDARRPECPVRREW
jgi:hypothetical protein